MTLKNDVDIKRDKKITCQSCTESFTFDDTLNLRSLADKVSKAKVTVNFIPDNAKINISFDT